MIRPLVRGCLNHIKSLHSRVVNKFDPPVVVLLYHRVTALQSDPQLLSISPEYFNAHLRYINDHFPVLRFEDDWSQVSERSVVVTFDDGYADNFLEALPIIEDIGIPVTFFVSSDAVGSQEEFWWDELERLILTAGFRPACCHIANNENNFYWETNSTDNRLKFYTELHLLMREWSPSFREACLKQLREWSGYDSSARYSHRALSVEELRGLASSRWVTIGAHGVTHTRFSNLSPEEQRHEIIQSKQRLEEICGKEIAVFSYPFGGRRDYNRATLNICRTAGFRRVAANFPGQVHSWSDKMQNPRQLIRNWPLDQFIEKLNGFFLL